MKFLESLSMITSVQLSKSDEITINYIVKDIKDEVLRSKPIYSAMFDIPEFSLNQNPKWYTRMITDYLINPDKRLFRSRDHQIGGLVVNKLNNSGFVVEIFPDYRDEGMPLWTPYKLRVVRNFH